jgi:CHASE2 domain-containing sensor protein
VIIPVAFLIGFAFRLTGLFDCPFPIYRLVIAAIIFTLAISLSISGGWILVHPTAGTKSHKPVGIAVFLLAICGIVYTIYELIAGWSYWALIPLAPQMIIFIIMFAGGLLLIKSESRNEVQNKSDSATN